MQIAFFVQPVLQRILRRPAAPAQSQFLLKMKSGNGESGKRGLQADELQAAADDGYLLQRGACEDLLGIDDDKPGAFIELFDGSREAENEETGQVREIGTTLLMKEPSLR
jgi:hypothetical protein